MKIIYILFILRRVVRKFYRLTHNVISDNMGVLRVKLKPTKMP